MGEVMATMNARGVDIDRFPVRPADLAMLIKMIAAGTVSHSTGKAIFGKMVETGDRPEAIAEREGLTQVGDDAQLIHWIDEVFAEHPQESLRYVNGERKLQGVLVGMVMKKSKGKADPKKLNQLLAARVTGA
jgi:aspartyl-tRNA(Asn)/glutamyl-tRNA(Gln) amidotransferase subunit B